MHIATQLKRTWFYTFFDSFDFLDNLVPRNRGAISRNQGAISRNRGAIQKVCGHYWYLPPKYGDSMLKCLVRPIQVNLKTYLRQRRMMLVVESPSSMIPSIVWLCQCMFQESLGIRLFEHAGVPNKMKQQLNAHFLCFCSTFFGNERFSGLSTF